MKLIQELNQELEYITEEADGKKKLYVEGIIMQAGIKNRNGRVYPEEVLSKEASRYIKEELDNNSAVGELGHPNGPNINQERVSHKFIKLEQSGKNWVGKAKITESLPCGKIAKGLIEEGIRVGISSRGMGTLKKNSSGVMEVQHDFRLATAGDLVHNPSAPDAYLQGLLEGAEWAFNPTTLMWEQVEKIESLKQDLKENIKKVTLSDKIRLFEAALSGALQNYNIHK